MRFEWKPVLVVALLAVCSAVAFQNCGNSMTFQASENLQSLLAEPVIPNYASATAGDADSFPPLKLLFVVDNSGTMGINQINLSSAFDRMFDGSNASNLAPFDTTAFVISTSQWTPTKDLSIYGKIPNESVDAFAALPSAQFSTHRGSTLNGKIPGDLLGYGVRKEVATDRTSDVIYPAPVALFKPNSAGVNSATLSARKPRGASVSSFSSDFKERLALLNPDLSAVDPVTKRGVMDDVIDRESGLCAVARMLKNNQGVFSPGDLASIVIVSDEDDQDPAGRACLDALVDAKGGANYIDGRCEMPQTTLKYRAEIANPGKAKCQVDFSQGISYRIDYKKATTDVAYYTKSMTYDQLQTDVSYFTSSQKYDLVETQVTYYTKSPTYQVPRTSVKYYVEVEDCDIRDGAKTNCRYSYPSSTTTIDGAVATTCDALVAGKLPSGALYNKAGYKPECSSAAARSVSGACATTDTGIINCQQNYSSPLSTKLTGKVTSTCGAFISGRLPSGSVYSDAGYVPTCGTIITTPKTGACSVSDTDKQNCETVYAAATKTVSGRPTASGCEATFSSQLPSNTVKGNSSKPITCVNGATITGKTGTCSATDTNVANCKTVYSASTTNLNLEGTPTAGCAAFVTGRLPSNAVYTDAGYLPTCANGAGKDASVTGTKSFASYPSTSFTAGGACGASVTSALVAERGLIVAASTTPTCVVSSINRSNQILSDLAADVTCASVNWRAVCDASGGSIRDCSATDIAAGEKYASAVTTVTRDGSFSCSTACSDTTFCQAKSGTVADNFYACDATPAAVAVKSTFTMESTTASCGAGQTRVVTKGPYQTTETRSVYVAGAGSESNSANALSDYIVTRSREIFKDMIPTVSVFVRQPGDTLGTNGSLGTNYNRFADMVAGKKRSVLGSSTSYASALEDLSVQITKQLGQSINFKDVKTGQQIRKVWVKRVGVKDFGQPLDETWWSASGGTVTIGPQMSIQYGDQFKIEYW